MTERYLFVLLQHLIKEAQKSIGLVAYKLTPDRNGMVSAGELMRQPFAFEMHVARSYNFNEKLTHGMHVVISNADYKLILYSSDPREGKQARTFAAPIDVARHCASSQMTLATKLSMSRDEEYKSINPKESFEQLMRYSELIQQHNTLEGRLELYLSSRKVRFINWLIKTLSKSTGACVNHIYEEIYMKTLNIQRFKYKLPAMSATLMVLTALAGTAGIEYIAYTKPDSSITRLLARILSPEALQFFFWGLTAWGLIATVMVLRFAISTQSGVSFVELGSIGALVPIVSFSRSPITIPYGAITQVQVINLHRQQMAIISSSAGESRLLSKSFATPSEFMSFLQALQERRNNG